MLLKTANKLSKVFHCSPQKVLQYYERLLEYYCTTYPEFSKHLQANYELEEGEIEALGGVFIKAGTSKRESKDRNRTLDRFT